MLDPSVASQVSSALSRRRTVRFIVAGLFFGVGLLAILAGEFKSSVFPLAMAFWIGWRAASLVPEVMEQLEERERNELRDLATGPVLRCPQCPWVSYNASITHCAECGTLLERVPQRLC